MRAGHCMANCEWRMAKGEWVVQKVKMQKKIATNQCKNKNYNNEKKRRVSLSPTGSWAIFVAVCVFIIAQH